jgi:hypothetical protein
MGYSRVGSSLLCRGDAVHLMIEMKRPEATKWEVLGQLTDCPEHVLAELRDLLEGQAPFEVMHQDTHQLVFDVLDVLKADGFQARIRFFEAH